MKQLKKLIAIVLSIAMAMCSTLPSLAVENDALQETTESKIVEQLKEDLGEERTVEILGGNVGVSTDGNFVEASTASLEEDTSMGELCGLEDDEEELVNEYEFSEPEEDETEVEEETDRLVSDDELESKELESDENGLTEETIVAETEEAISETEIIESSEVESNDDEVVVATGSEIQDTLLDLDEIVSLSSNEKLLGAGEVWCYWYVDESDSNNKTIHYSGTQPANFSSYSKKGSLSSNSSPSPNSTIKQSIKTAIFDNEVIAVTTESWFYGFTNLTNIENISNLNTSNVTHMSMMFYDCSSLASLDLTGLDTSSVRFMSNMFDGCENLEQVDLSGFDTSSLERMYNMFEDCSSLTTLDLSSFDTRNVEEMQSMFEDCSSLMSINFGNTYSFGNSCIKMYSMFRNCSSLTTLDLSNFNTSSVESMNWMFYDCNSLETILFGDNFNTESVKDMGGMFKNCRNLTTLDLSGFETHNVGLGRENLTEEEITKDNSFIEREFGGMFSGCVNLESIQLGDGFKATNAKRLGGMFRGCSNLESIDLSNFETTNAAIMCYMFNDCSSLTSLNLSGFDTSNVINMCGMFQNCSNLTSIDLSGFDTHSVTSMRWMFSGCSNLTSLDLTNFNTENVLYMYSMFYNCSSLTTLDLSSFNTLNVSYDSDINVQYGFGHMFSDCRSLASINLSSFDTRNVRYMEWMFNNCNSLTDLDLSNFDTSSVKNMNAMFNACSSLTSLDLSSFNTSSVTNMNMMFLGCTNLQTIYASSDFVTTNVVDGSGMFNNCRLLVGGNGTSYSNLHLDKTYARIDTAGTPGYFTLAGGGAPTLSTITVNTQPTKVKYKVGETFDPIGLKINLNYSDSSTTTVTYNSTTSSDFTFSPSTAFDTAGNSIPVTVTYSGKNCIQNVVVIEPQSISIKTAPTKVKYAIGETFDPTGLKINLIYSDTTTVEEVAYAGNVSDFSFNPSGALNTAGASIPITITYTRNGNNFDCVQNVEVVELSTITINTPPTKTRYIKGTNFDATGLKINLNYSDSTTNVVEYNTTTSASFTFDGSSTLTLDTLGNPFVITIGYAGKTTTQNVVVAELDSIEIANHATKLNYMSGDTFDPAGMAIRLTYSDSITETVAYNSTTSSSFTFSPLNPLTRTGNVITVTYGGKSTTETLNVKELTGITIATNPTKLSYATGQSLNPAGLVLTLTYNDSNNANTTENVTYNSTTQSKFAFNPSGTAITTGNVTVTYDGKTGAGMQPTFAITVRTVASISVVNRPSKTSYLSGNKLALSGLSIKVNYTNGTNETVAYSPNNANDFTFSPSTSTSLNTGHNSVTVTYGGKSTNFAISVTQSSGGYVPSNGGGSSGGSGGGGGGGGIPAGTNPLNNTPATTQVSQGKSISGVVSSDTSTWTSDPLTGKYKLNTLDASGNPVPVSNGFYMVINTVTEVVNNVPIQTQVNNTYYFDTQGNMVTGWVQTADNKWFFFENAKTADEGKMSLGWKQVQGSWYYFTPNGSMMENGITPDGFIIGADGKWIG